VGWEKVARWSTKTTIGFSLKRVNIGLEEKLLWGPVESHKRSFDFLGRRYISTSGFAYTATDTAVFALFLPVQLSNRYSTVYKWTF